MIKFATCFEAVRCTTISVRVDGLGAVHSVGVVAAAVCRSLVFYDFVVAMMRLQVPTERGRCRRGALEFAGVSGAAALI